MDSANLTIGEILRRDANAFPDKLAVVDYDRSFTYAELDNEVDAFSSALLDMGVRKGDRVAALFFNQWELLVTYFGVTRIGASIVTINNRLLPVEMAFPLRDARCKVLVYAAAFEQAVAQLPDLAQPEHLVVAGSVESHLAAAELSSLLDEHRGQRPRFAWQVSQADESGVWYTSGTTGTPKGAIVTHYGSIWSAVGTALAIRLDERSRILGVAPIFHRGAMEDIHLGGFLVGATHFMLHRFDAATMMKMVQSHRITHAFIVPSMIWAVLSLPDRGSYDLSSMVAWMTASAPFPEEYRDRLEADTTLLKDRVFNVYGTTESLINAYLPPEIARQHPGSVGWPAVGTQVSIVDGDHNEVPVGEVGEIALSSASMACGYLGHPEAWAEATFEREGRLWYLSGDLGRIDKDRCLYIVDRSKDMVISGGENVYSIEVELTLVHHSAVAEAAVVGIPDERWGEMVAAMVVPRQGAVLTAEELIEYCSERLAGYKRPRLIVFAEALPRNSMGKIQKRRVVEMVRAIGEASQEPGRAGPSGEASPGQSPMVASS